MTYVLPPISDALENINFAGETPISEEIYKYRYQLTASKNLFVPGTGQNALTSFEQNISSQSLRFEENAVFTLKMQKLDRFIETFESFEMSKPQSPTLIGNSRSMTRTDTTPKQVETDWNFQFKKDRMKEFTVNENQTLWKSHRFKALIFNPEAKDATFEVHFNLVQKSLHYLTKLKTSTELMVDKKSVKLPSKSEHSKILFFEIQDVLLSDGQRYKENEEKMNSLEFIKLRPFCLEILKILSKYYEIYLFTTDTAEYTSMIMKFIDPLEKIFKGALTINYCFKTHLGRFIKDLRIVTNKNLKDMIIVDCLENKGVLPIDNLIPILKWDKDPKDGELKYLTRYLLAIQKYEDVRRVNRKKFKLQKLMNETSIIEK